MAVFAAQRSGLAGWQAQHASKGYVSGTHRTVMPAQTLARLQPLLAAMGITRVANVTGLDVIGIPVVVVCRPNSRALAVSQGKGLTLEGAKASGIMESAESYHAERVSGPLLLASQDELVTRCRLVDVNRLPMTELARFHRRLPILWIEGFDLLQGQPTWVPYDTVHTDFTLERERHLCGFIPSSNGLAGGNHLLEALSHALLELIERDAWVRWENVPDEAKRETRLNLASISGGPARALLAAFAAAGMAVAVWETTRDIRIPSFRCLVADAHPDPLRRMCVAYGSGCHLSREVALLRAMTEAAQSRLTLIAGTRDDLLAADYERLLEPVVTGQLSSLLREPGLRNFNDSPQIETSCFEDDIAEELKTVQAAGIEQVIAVDLTIPQIGIPVVKVVVPGLKMPTSSGGRPASRAGAPPHR